MNATPSEGENPVPDLEAGKGEDPRATRFCSSCSRTKPVSGGHLVRCANGAKRWKCAECIARSKAHMAALRASKGKEPD